MGRGSEWQGSSGLTVTLPFPLQILGGCRAQFGPGRARPQALALPHHHAGTGNKGTHCQLSLCPPEPEQACEAASGGAAEPGAESQPGRARSGATLGKPLPWLEYPVVPGLRDTDKGDTILARRQLRFS